MSKSVSQEKAKTMLAELRQSIDNIDAALIYMLSERFSCTKKVGYLKAKANFPATDLSREEAQISRLRELALASKLDPIFAEKFLRFIIKEVIQNHEQIAKSENIGKS
ncbi:chorismate mutase [Acinetobacter ihumii]|uniref:chorismate mutase n=1 Tax=Acinetobacter ihumii TaxID=2483802 RepID=UPI00102F67E1|nr:chorismate mutase [Acinetobacter ihumii]